MEKSRPILWSCFVVVGIFAASIQGYDSPTVEIEPKGSVAVKVGDSLQIMCKINEPLRFCRVEVPNVPPMLLSQDGAPEEGISYFGRGYESGECGIRIANVRESFNGLIKCGMVPVKTSREASGSVNVVVAKPPNRPELLLSHGSGDGRQYKRSDRVWMSCMARNGRPAANVSLYLGDELLQRDQTYNIYNQQLNENDKSIVNVSRTLDWMDHGKTLRCVAEHIALDQPLIEQRRLEVLFQPQPQATIERFGYVIGRPGIINATVYANPRPNFIWRVGDEEIAAGKTDISERLQTTSGQELNPGQWYVELKIDSVQKSDTEKTYILEARNDEGTTSYNIRLSTSAEPEGFDLDAGYIIGIVVGILVLVLLVALIIFARATGRWCFADGSSTRNIGESSDTESAGRYSRSETDGGSGRPRRPKIPLSALFKRNKDKVAGTDTDTMRTVVTVDDEKVPESADVTQQPKTQTTAEGGLVYAELDLTQREVTPPRRASDDKTEYAEIVYPKGGQEADDKK